VRERAARGNKVNNLLGIRKRGTKGTVAHKLSKFQPQGKASLIRLTGSSIKREQRSGVKGTHHGRKN